MTALVTKPSVPEYTPETDGNVASRGVIADQPSPTITSSTAATAETIRPRTASQSALVAITPFTQEDYVVYHGALRSGKTESMRMKASGGGSLMALGRGYRSAATTE